MAATTSNYPDVDALELPVHHMVPRSGAGRKLAWMLGILLVLLPVLLILVPWQQNVPGAGRITAFDPLDRIQVIVAPVTGRLVELKVREGSRVKLGEEIAVMEDLDPLFAQRLEAQKGFADTKLLAAHENLERADQAVISLEDSRDAAVEKATADFEQAIEKVTEAEQKQEAVEKELVAAEADFVRQSRLFDKGQASQKDFQEAEAKYRSLIAKVEAEKAAVKQARFDRQGKEADIRKVRAAEQAKIDKAKGDRTKAQQELEVAKSDAEMASSDLARQLTQVIRATADGTVLRAEGANFSGLINKGDPVLEIVPDTDQLAVEMWMRGIDAPLVQVGRTARMQFEGWPAVQFAGWPSVAVGTFGGIVAQVDAQAAADGRVRVLILPDPNDESWPSDRFLRQGVRASGWVQLETVSTGYEIWRQLNAFPPTIQTGPATDLTRDKKKGGKDEGKGGEKGGKGKG